MTETAYDLHGVHVLQCATEGASIRTAGDATDLISKAWEERAKVLAIPVERLDKDFFQLSSGVAGEIVQKFATYKMRVAILGDISRYVDGSKSLRDFVRETNRGDQLWFVANHDEISEHLIRLGLIRPS
jgi:Domain of unknown function (DUF4180)